ncbi:TRPT1, partial [Symbiodinium sp. CCMP2456]
MVGDTPASTLDSVASSVLSQVYVPFDFGQPPPRPLKFSRDFKISKRLSASLRHDKGDFNLDFRRNMTAPLSQLLAHRIMTEVGVTQEEIIAAVYHNEKQRFRLLWECGPEGVYELLIGAVQGHSMAVDNASVHRRVDPAKVPYLTHATHYDFYRNIARDGLRAGGAAGKAHRAQVHCLPDCKNSEQFYPDKADVILRINPALANCTWYMSANGYYLTDDTVPPESIVAVIIRATGEVVLPTDGKAPPPKADVLKGVLKAHLSSRASTQGGRSSAPPRKNRANASHRRAYMAALLPDTLDQRLAPITEEAAHHRQGGICQQQLHFMPTLEERWSFLMHWNPDAAPLIPLRAPVTSSERRFTAATIMASPSDSSRLYSPSEAEEPGGSDDDEAWLAPTPEDFPPNLELSPLPNSAWSEDEAWRESSPEAPASIAAGNGRAEPGTPLGQLLQR